MVLRLLVSTWGDPLNWGLATYNCDEDLGVSGARRGHVTLVCYGVDNVVVIVPDSVISTTVTQPKHPIAARCYQQVLGSPPGQLGSALNCVDLACWRGLVRDYINCVMTNIGYRAHVIPTASIGAYGTYQFKGWPELVQVDMLVQLMNYVRGLQCPGDGRVEVLIDLTHGVNYLPAITLGTVLNYLAPSMAIKCGAQVVVKAYNAVPIGGNQYDFHKVFSRVVSSVEPPGGRFDRLIRAFTSAMPLAIARECASFSAQNIAVIGSVTHPTPQSMGSISYEANVPKVGDAASMVMAEEICGRAKGFIVNVGESVMLSIDAVNSLFSLAHRFSGDLGKVTEVEVQAVYETVSSKVLLSGSCVRLCDLYGHCSEDVINEAERVAGGSEPSSRFVRNFLAHGGMIRELVKVCYEDGTKLIGYLDEKDDVRLAKLIDKLINTALS